MPNTMTSAVALVAEISRVASAAGGSPRELMGLWGPLREILPFTAAWLGMVDTGGARFLTAAADDLDPAIRAYVESPEYYTEVESSGIWRRRQPMCLRESGLSIDCPFSDRLWWPAGQHDGVGVPLITGDGRPVGLLVLLTDAIGHLSDNGCQVIGKVAPMIAAAIDPMTSITGLTGLVADAQASAVIGPGGAIHPLPGSPLHPLLSAGSQMVSIASDRLRTHRSPSAFLYPYPEDDPHEYLRVTVIACPSVPSSPFDELVIVSPPGDLHGLTRRELEVLGLVIDGSTNRQIASALFITQRTVAAHLEHIRSKLDVPSRTAAAVRSLDRTLYVLPQSAGTVE
jgi:DNA-binding CsgD family transcriptional regulator